jgi:hypothetical protein
MPKRIQRKRTKGWRMPANTIYVGRPTQWGNPFDAQLHIGRQFTADECVKMYENWLTIQIPILLSEIRETLRGKDLACWCPLDRPCHADVLLRLANSGPEAFHNSR